MTSSPETAATAEIERAPKKITAPWSDDQVRSLNLFQTGPWHPFTCGTRDTAAHMGKESSLIATAEGWTCEFCDYRQTWAHAFMGDLAQIEAGIATHRDFFEKILRIQSAPLLVVVHPGSACGSADFNLGKYEASAQRDGLIATINNWQGAIAIIDGSLTHELKEPRYLPLHHAIKSAIFRARDNSYMAIRRWGCDDQAPHQAEAARGIIAKYNLPRGSVAVTVTGAWYDPSDEAGCVNDVIKVFEQAGIPTHLDEDGVIRMDSDDDGDSEDEAHEA